MLDIGHTRIPAERLYQGLHSYDLYSYGLYSYGLHGYCLCELWPYRHQSTPNTCQRLYTCLCTSLYKHVFRVGCTHLRMHERVYANISRSAQACMHACMHACRDACMHAYMHACMHACMHAFMHACRDVTDVPMHMWRPATTRAPFFFKKRLTTTIAEGLD